MQKKNCGAGLLAVIVAMTILAISTTYSLYQLFPLFQQIQLRQMSSISHQISVDAVLDYLVVSAKNRRCLNKKLETVDCVEKKNDVYISFDALVTGEGTTNSSGVVDLTKLDSSELVWGFFPPTPGVPRPVKVRYVVAPTVRYGNSGASDSDSGTEVFLTIQVQVETKSQKYGTEYFNATSRLAFFERPLNSLTFISPNKLVLGQKCASSSVSYEQNKIASDVCLDPVTADKGITFHAPVLFGMGISLSGKSSYEVPLKDNKKGETGTVNFAPIYFEDTVFIGSEGEVTKNSETFVGGLSAISKDMVRFGNGVVKDSQKDEGLAKLFDTSTDDTADPVKIYACQQMPYYSPIFSTLFIKSSSLSSSTNDYISEYKYKELPKIYTSLTGSVKLALSDRNYFVEQYIENKDGTNPDKYYYLPTPQVSSNKWIENHLDNSYDDPHKSPFLNKAEGSKSETKHGAIMNIYVGELEHQSREGNQFGPPPTAIPLDKYPWHKDKTKYEEGEEDLDREQNRDDVQKLDLKKFYASGSEDLGSKKFPYVVKAAMGNGDTLQLAFVRDNRTVYELLKEQEKFLYDKWNNNWHDDVSNPFPYNYYLTYDSNQKSNFSGYSLSSRMNAVAAKAKKVIHSICDYLKDDLPGGQAVATHYVVVNETVEPEPETETPPEGQGEGSGENNGDKNDNKENSEGDSSDGVEVKPTKIPEVIRKVTDTSHKDTTEYGLGFSSEISAIDDNYDNFVCDAIVMANDSTDESKRVLNQFSDNGLDALDSMCDKVEGSDSDCNNNYTDPRCFPFPLSESDGYIPTPIPTQVPIGTTNECESGGIRCVCHGDYSEINSNAKTSTLPDKFLDPFLPQYPDGYYSSYSPHYYYSYDKGESLPIRPRLCGRFVVDSDEETTIKYRSASSRKELCKTAVSSLREFINDVNRYLALAQRFQEMHIPMLKIKLTWDADKHPEEAKFDFTIDSPHLMPHKVSFNIEVFDKLARTVIVGKDGNRPVLDVEYENTKGQLRKGLKDNKDVSDNWAENQPAGPNRHFLWNKISIIKNDKDGTFSIGPEITGPYETPTADGPTYLFGPSSVAAQKIYSDKLYSCSGTTEGIKTAPLTTSIYFLAGMNNGYYRHSKLTGSYPSNYLTDLDKTNCFSKAVFGNWTNYKKITDSYLNLVKNRLAEKKDGSFKVLQADCNPLIRPLITPTPLDNDNPVKRKFANDPDNCHFFPSDSYDPGAFKKVCKDMKEDKAKTRSLWHNADSKVKPDPQKFDADKLLFVSLDSSKDVKCQSDYKLGMDGDKKTQNIDTGAIIKHCVVPSNVDLVAGFYVCDHMTIESRSSRLDMVGTFIVGSLTIESGAYSAGIHWHSAFSTVGTKLLREKGYLRYTTGASVNNETKEVTDISTGTCPADGRFSGNDTDYWGEVNGKDDTYLETQRMMRQCNPTYALKSLNRNFMRSAFDASNDNLKYYQGVEVERDRAQMAQAPLSVAGE